ncbi:polysaccharide pyruvyl transferase family protein [Chamaesiphon sp. VAR_48_metabat_135_sub]|uniref:polysaccharide pyruvyl transferase family protein n=1 Tax=Chamaesiphon sp. VAR_48_metabat_135_sub TaxID=2964699 RepID=UPI00286BB400|nr:polysaccharide pyruvyl transferase family protein [Chamaesiphon sp. VAR_48_metabat_135_sub]
MRQVIRPPDLAILGSFHGVNTGDQSLGLSVKNCIKQSIYRSGFQNIFSLKNYPKCQLTICAGGATGIESIVTELAKRNADRPEMTALVGMNFADDVANFPASTLEFLQQVSHISCRSKRQVQQLAEILHKDDILYTPDNAFAYPFQSLSRGIDAHRQPKVLGFNVLNLFMTWVRGKGFVPGTPLADWYRSNNSDIISYIDRIGPAYIKYFNSVISIYRARGWEIVHIPFTPEDDLFAKTFFRSHQIKYHSFSPQPDVIFSHLQKCSLFISTRFHALVFALIANVPCVPVNYAIKCNDLLTDLNIDTALSIDRYQLVDSLDRSIAKTVCPQPLLLSRSTLELLRRKATSNINSAFQSISQKQYISKLLINKNAVQLADFN